MTGDETGLESVTIVNVNPCITHPAHEWLYHTTGVYAPYSLRKAVWVLLRPTRIRTVKGAEMGPMIFRPHPKKLE